MRALCKAWTSRVAETGNSYWHEWSKLVSAGPGLCQCIVEVMWAMRVMWPSSGIDIYRSIFSTDLGPAIIFVLHMSDALSSHDMHDALFFAPWLCVPGQCFCASKILLPLALILHKYFSSTYKPLSFFMQGQYEHHAQVTHAKHFEHVQNSHRSCRIRINYTMGPVDLTYHSFMRCTSLLRVSCVDNVCTNYSFLFTCSFQFNACIRHVTTLYGLVNGGYHWCVSDQTRS